MERKACGIYHANIDALKISVTKEWHAIPKATVKSVCHKFPSHIEACIAAEGGIFEKNSKGITKHHCSPKSSRNIVESYLHVVILVPDNFFAWTFGTYCITYGIKWIRI